jgi:carbon-monoxide dehydrogenase catalytic subunit
MSENPVSYHDSVNQMYERVKQDQISNVQDRYEAQEKVRCQYCVKGTTCQLCSLGPCRITPKSELGACGIGPDSMAMRNLLQRTIMGIAAYTYHANDVAKTIKATAQGNTPFAFKDPGKIKFMAETFGIEGNDINTLAEAVADRMIAEINRDGDDPSPMVEIFAPQKRKELWKKYGILPGGPLHEMMSASTSAMTNVDGDHVSLALKALRLGLACTYGSLINLELGQDALFGTPSPHEIDVDMRQL